MKYRLFYIDQPFQVDLFIIKNLGLVYGEEYKHPFREYEYPTLFSCVILDEEQLLILKLTVGKEIKAFPVEE